MKIGEWLEKNVQWIAVGLAVVWLLWVGWAYGINRPEIEMNGVKYSPGAIDEHIRDDDMQALVAKTGNSNVPAGLVDVPEFTDAFVSAMNGRQANPYPAFAFNSAPQYQVVFETAQTRREKVPVKQLPGVVIPTEVATVAGRSQVTMPGEKPK